MSMKCDLHVHSKYSNGFSKGSMAEPRAIYRLAREQGMDLVTITDQNTLEGALEIAHLEGSFMSEEISTYFPQDRSALRVLAYDVTECQHREISRLKENVHDLVRYLNEQRIVHALAHPFYAVDEWLTLEHIDQALLLFKNFELSGARDEYQKAIMQEILKNITQKEIERLSDRYNMLPIGPEPWKKNLINSSGDHTSLHIGQCYTEVAEARSLKDFLEGIQKGRSRTIDQWAGFPYLMRSGLHPLFPDRSPS